MGTNFRLGVVPEWNHVHPPGLAQPSLQDPKQIGQNTMEEIESPQVSRRHRSSKKQYQFGPIVIVGRMAWFDFLLP
jgi:hypothetical protein